MVQEYMVTLRRQLDPACHGHHHYRGHLTIVTLILPLAAIIPPLQRFINPAPSSHLPRLHAIPPHLTFSHPQTPALTSITPPTAPLPRPSVASQPRPVSSSWKLVFCELQGRTLRSKQNMGMQRALMWLMMRSQAQAWSSSSGVLAQRGAAALSWQQVREYVSSTSSAVAFPLDGFSRSESSESTIGKRQPAWQGWSRGYADSSVQKDDVLQGNVEVLEFGTHKTTTSKRFAVGRTAIVVDEVQDIRTEEMRKEKAEEILRQVGEKLDETVEEAKVRQLQETLVRTEGIGEVVQELYNKPEVDHTTEYQTGASA